MDHCHHLQLTKRHRLDDSDSKAGVKVKATAVIPRGELEVLYCYANGLAIRSIAQDKNVNKRTVVALIRRNLRLLLPPSPDTFLSKCTTSRSRT